MRRSPMVLIALVLFLGASLLAGCSGADDTKASARRSATPTGPMSLSLLVFNVEYGGTRATNQVIAGLDADVARASTAAMRSGPLTTGRCCRS